jgi:hypothetical protein
MKSAPSPGPRAVLLADLVASRAVPDRAALHRRVEEVLERANRQLRPVTPLRVTVGDEYQGAFATVGQALRAATWLRVELAVGDPSVEVRHGVAWGTAQLLRGDPPVEDGPAWWAARDAVEEAEAASRRPGSATRRTAYRRVDDDGPDPALVEALLLCQDHLLGSLSSRSLRLLRGLLAGRSQAGLAEDEGVSASAVSQRVRRDGLATMVEVDAALGRVR